MSLTACAAGGKPARRLTGTTMPTALLRALMFRPRTRTAVATMGSVIRMTRMLLVKGAIAVGIATTGVITGVLTRLTAAAAVASVLTARPVPAAVASVLTARPVPAAVASVLTARPVPAAVASVLTARPARVAAAKGLTASPIPTAASARAITARA